LEFRSAGSCHKQQQKLPQTTHSKHNQQDRRNDLRQRLVR